MSDATAASLGEISQHDSTGGEQEPFMVASGAEAESRLADVGARPFVVTMPCILPQPPIGAVTGCGELRASDEPHICKSWVSLGISDTAQIGSHLEAFARGLSVPATNGPVVSQCMPSASETVEGTRVITAKALIIPKSAEAIIKMNELQQQQLLRQQQLQLQCQQQQHQKLIEQQQLQQLQLQQQRQNSASTSIPPSVIQSAAISIASNLVMLSGAGPSTYQEHSEGFNNPQAKGMLACRLPQPPDGRWLGCGQAAHAPSPCFAWQQQGLLHSSQIHDSVYAFKRAHLRASATSQNRMCAMRQPPPPDSIGGPLKKGCGQPTHPDHVCATWIAYGIMTAHESRQMLSEYRKKYGNVTAKDLPKVKKEKSAPRLPIRDRCIIPQPPDGKVRGCLSNGHHRGSLCESWIKEDLESVSQIRARLMETHAANPDCTVELCQFAQPPDGSDTGCGAPHHKGKICGSWGELNVLTRQEALKSIRAYRLDHKPTKRPLVKSGKSDVDRNCNLQQPPDGRIIGCGDFHLRNTVCDSWIAFGVMSRDNVKGYIESYRSEYEGDQGGRICRALQPPDGRIKGCGMGWHRATCEGWQKLGVYDRKAVNEHIAKALAKDLDRGSSSPKRRCLFPGVNRVDEFPDYANDLDQTAQFFLTGDYERSIQELTKRMLHDPDNALLYNNRGIVYFERGWRDLALRDWNRVVELDRSCADALANRALLRLTLGKPISAGDDSGAAMDLCGPACDVSILVINALALFDMGDFVRCAMQCEDILLQDPSSFDGTLLLGLTLGAQHDFAGSSRQFQRLLVYHPDNAHVQLLVDIANRMCDDVNGGVVTLAPVPQPITSDSNPASEHPSQQVSESEQEDDVDDSDDSDDNQSEINGNERCDPRLDSTPTQRQCSSDDDDDNDAETISDEDSDSFEDE